MVYYLEEKKYIWVDAIFQTPDLLFSLWVTSFVYFQTFEFKIYNLFDNEIISSFESLKEKKYYFKI